MILSHFIHKLNINNNKSRIKEFRIKVELKTNEKIKINLKKLSKIMNYIVY